RKSGIIVVFSVKSEREKKEWTSGLLAFKIGFYFIFITNKLRAEFLDKVTEMRLVDSMCLVETLRTEKEVWSWVKKCLRSDLDIRFISASPLINIAQGLKDIHNKELVHRDFHPGNILNSDIHSFITDLGLLAYEVLSGLPPYVTYDEKEKCYKELAHDHSLAEKICQGLRPQFEVKIPQLLKNLIERCEVNSQNNTEFFQQFKDKEEFLNNLTSLDYKTHPSALYTSRRLDFKSLPESQNSKEINEIFYSSDSKQINLEIPVDLDQLNLNEENQQPETQVQIQAPNK
ncbi:9824_t:CDS:2, partial [Paraglomus brasilianum]